MISDRHNRAGILQNPAALVWLFICLFLAVESFLVSHGPDDLISMWIFSFFWRKRFSEVEFCWGNLLIHCVSVTSCGDMVGIDRTDWQGQFCGGEGSTESSLLSDQGLLDPCLLFCCLQSYLWVYSYPSYFRRELCKRGFISHDAWHPLTLWSLDSLCTLYKLGWLH